MKGDLRLLSNVEGSPAELDVPTVNAPYDAVTRVQEELPRVRVNAESVGVAVPFEPATQIDPTPFGAQVGASLDGPVTEMHPGSPHDADDASSVWTVATLEPLTDVLGSSRPPDSPPTRDPDDPLAGTPYRTIRLLATGGTAEVYLAEDLEVNEPVVVKLQRVGLDPSFDARMALEARVYASLDHPNIVQVSRFSRTPAGRLYVALERLYGRTLRQELKQSGPLPVERAVEFGRQILDGLAAAHARGLIHRDIKLDNLYLCDTPDGFVIKILDFGMAKVLPDVEIDTRNRIDPLELPTEAGMFVGTARYAAPEQATPRTGIDQRADLYAVGTVLYALLADEEPFADVHGIGELLLAHQHRELDFDFAKRTEPLPAALLGVLRRALSKDPDSRFTTTQEFAAELAKVLPGAPRDDGAATSAISTGGATSAISTVATDSQRTLAPTLQPVESPTASAKLGLRRAARWGGGLLIGSAIVVCAAAFWGRSHRAAPNPGLAVASAAVGLSGSTIAEAPTVAPSPGSPSTSEPSASASAPSAASGAAASASTPVPTGRNLSPKHPESASSAGASGSRARFFRKPGF